VLTGLDSAGSGAFDGRPMKYPAHAQNRKQQAAAVREDRSSKKNLQRIYFMDRPKQGVDLACSNSKPCAN
jgi:hypothetical protein